MYALFALIAVISTLVLLKAKDATFPNDDQASNKTSKRKQYLLWTLYTILVTAGLWTQYLLALVFFAQFVWFIKVTYKKSFKLWLKNSYQIICSHIGAAILFIPWLPVLASQEASENGGGWRGQITPTSPVTFFSQVLFYQEPANLIEGFATLFWIVIILYIYVMFIKNVCSAKCKNSVVVFVAFIPVVLLSIIPFISHYFYARYMIGSVVFIVLTVALIVRQNLASKALLLALVVVFSIGQYNLFQLGSTDGLNDYTAAFAKIETNGEAQIVTPAEQGMFYTLAAYESDDKKVHWFEEDLEGTFGAQDMERDSKDVRIDTDNLQSGTVLWNIDERQEKRGYINTHPEKFELLSEEVVDSHNTTVRKYRVK